MAQSKRTYAASGVSYEAMDPFKVMAQRAAVKTAKNLKRFNYSEVSSSRGESAYLIEAADFYLSQVEEGLGSKNLIADSMHTLTKKQYYANVAQDTVAMIVNDMITIGALPVSVAMHLAAGSSDWFSDKKRMSELIRGWQKACNLARCVWGGGETPTLKGLINPESVTLSGSAMGIIQPKDRFIKGSIQDGDVIVMLASSGVHANGLTLARQIADEKTGYAAKLSDGRMYGEALLDPTYIYVPIIEDCQNKNIDLHYTVNITGHGWRKLMRAVEPFVYIIERIPKSQPVFKFIQKHGPVTTTEMYGNYNMGTGFAIYVSAKDAKSVIQISKQNGINAWIGGKIKKQARTKKVIIAPLGIEYKGSSLSVR